MVAGIIGSYLHGYSHTHSWPGGRFIYSEVIAGLSILLALVWLLPLTNNFHHWPTDIILSLAWFAVFGLLVNYIGGTNCKSSVFNWTIVTSGGVCGRWKASEAFSFLSAIFWLASALVGIWFMRRLRDHHNADAVAANDGAG